MEKVPAKLKHTTEDFIVEEIQGEWICKISEDFVQPPLDSLQHQTEQAKKDFLWCEMEKRGIDHFTAIKIVADFLFPLDSPSLDSKHQTRQRGHRTGQENLQRIGYAGTKDKDAHTAQRISIEKPDIEKLKNFSHPNIILKNFKWNKRKIKMGYLDANQFRITLRDIDKKDAMKVSSYIRKKDFFANYFGAQRFGIDGGNVEIGKRILKRDFFEALRLIRASKGSRWPQADGRETGETNGALRELKRVPRKILLMYVNAVQSAIFNDIVTQALEEGLDLEAKGQQNGILAGYKTRFSNGRLGEIEREVLERYDLSLEDFDVREIPFLRMKGSFRKAIVRLKDLDVEVGDDEEFLGAKKILLEFTLPSGVYATTFLGNFFELT